jgi:D-sedoheptulose 7-phosphate isomerase
MNCSPEKHIREIIAEHRKMLDTFETEDTETVASIANEIITAIKAGGTVYLCGNGGSAADAQHIAAEFIGRFQRERQALPAIALTTDTSALTSIANDYSYENVFARQVEALVKEHDIFWALSTSGSSKNIIKAAKLAASKGTKIIAFTGRTPSKLEEISDICLCGESDSTAASQQIHQLAYHIICDLVEWRFARENVD